MPTGHNAKPAKHAESRVKQTADQLYTNPLALSTGRWRRIFRGCAACCILGALWLAASDWRGRWGDIITDTGRELDVPKQLLAGKMLYRDVRYWYGPLAPCLNAVL